LEEQKKEIISESISLADVEKHVKKLRLSNSKLNVDEQRKIVEDINNFIKIPERRYDFLSLLPKHSEGLHLIGIGLYSSSKHIVSRTLEIMRKLYELRVGKEIFSNLNINIQCRYYEQASLMMNLSAFNAD